MKEDDKFLVSVAADLISKGIPEATTTSDSGYRLGTAPVSTISFKPSEPFGYLVGTPTVEMTPVSIDWPIAMWMGATPTVGDRYALEVYEVADSKIPGNIAVKLRPVKI